MDEETKTDIGVIVGRFQVDNLHEAHHNLITTVITNHTKVLIFIGNSPTKVTRKNPLDFITRKIMILNRYPEVTVLPIKDMASDDEWSKAIDERIEDAFDMGTITMYGSRDGFIPHYSGKHNTVTLEATVPISGTKIRESIRNTIGDSDEFRKGVIYAAYNKYPIAYHTVDAAILKTIFLSSELCRNQVLLAHKKTDDKDKWRFVGGFVDPTQDKSAEDAVKREVYEETSGIEVSEPKYIGSALIKDWRYVNEADNIITSFFVMDYNFGVPKAADDIQDLKWFNIDDIIKRKLIDVVDEHHILFNQLISYLKKEK